MHCLGECRCAHCGVEAKAPAPAVATTTPFGPRIHALAIYLKGFQALSYERLRGLFRDAFGLGVSEGALMNMFIRSHPRFEIEAEKAKAIVRAAQVVASDETGVRIEGTNSYHWVFHCKDAVVHQPDYSRAARVVDEMMAGHKPTVWISDRYSAQQKHGERHQTCLAHLARDTAFALEHGSDAGVRESRYAWHRLPGCLSRVRVSVTSRAPFENLRKMSMMVCSSCRRSQFMRDAVRSKDASNRRGHG